MNRSQLEHLVRAAAGVTGVSDLLVIGSQSVLGTHPDWELPAAAIVSVEADIAVDSSLAGAELAVDETALADQIDGALGEGSLFHQTYGYFAQGVEVATASLVLGWRDRLVALPCPTPDGQVVGWCLSVLDAWVSKAAAARAKDYEFCGALARAGLVEARSCRRLVAHLQRGDRARAEAVLARSW